MPDRRILWLSDEDEVAGPTRRTAPTTWSSSGSSRAAGLALCDGRRRGRETGAHAAPAEHRARHLSAASTASGRSGSTLRPSVQFRPHELAVNRVSGAGLHVVRRRGIATSCRAARTCRRFGCTLRGKPRRVDARRSGICDGAVSDRAEPRLRAPSGRCGARGISGADLTAAESATLVASTESWDTIEALTASGRGAGRSRAPPAAPRRSLTPVHDGFGAELVLAADQFIITPAGRVEDAARAHAAGDEVRTVIAGYHWFTDWGRDTMISLEGLTLCTGRLREAALHPAHVRALRPRRPDPEPVPRRRAAKACTTPPTRRCGSSTRSTATRARPDDRETLRALLPTLVDIVHHHLQGTRFGIGVDPDGRSAAAGSRGLSADLDGREGRRLGRDAAPRQGRRDQRAVVQRAASARRLAARRTGRRRRHVALRRTPSVPASRSTSGSGTPTAATCTTSSTARAATTARAGPIRCSRSRSIIRCSTTSRWTAGARTWSGAAAHAGRTAFAGARASRTTRRSTSAICARATRRTTRARSGPG